MREDEDVKYKEQLIPKVSIVIPVYNGSKYLREAINSAISQTYNNIEIIVINDGSNDGGMTENIIHSYGNQVRYRCKKNGGVASALNEGIKFMSGEFFSWLSHDDVYLPEKIETQMALMMEFSQPTVLYSDYELIDHQSSLCGRVCINSYDPSKFREALILDNPIHGCSVLIPRVCFDKAGLFNEELRTTQDYDLWFRMAEIYKFVHIPVVLLRSREHSEQGTITMSSLHIRECNDYLVSGMRHLLADRAEMDVCKKSTSLFVVACAISFRKRGFLEPASEALRAFIQQTGIWRLLFNSHYRILLLRYLVCGFPHLIQRVRLRFLQ